MNSVLSTPESKQGTHSLTSLIFYFHCLSGYFIKSGICGNVVDAADKTKATVGSSASPGCT